MILFCEDDQLIAETITEFLKELDYQFKIVKNITNALEAVEDTQPDLIFCDLLMHGEYAFETIEKLKSNPKTHHIKIIAMTALLDKNNLNKAKDAGVDQIISKPFKLAELVKIIEEYTDEPKS